MREAAKYNDRRITALSAAGGGPGHQKDVHYTHRREFAGRAPCALRDNHAVGPIQRGVREREGKAPTGHGRAQTNTVPVRHQDAGAGSARGAAAKEEAGPAAQAAGGGQLRSAQLGAREEEPVADGEAQPGDLAGGERDIETDGQHRRRDRAFAGAEGAQFRVQGVLRLRGAGLRAAEGRGLQAGRVPVAEREAPRADKATVGMPAVRAECVQQAEERGGAEHRAGERAAQAVRRPERGDQVEAGAEQAGRGGAGAADLRAFATAGPARSAEGYGAARLVAAQHQAAPEDAGAFRRQQERQESRAAHPAVQGVAARLPDRARQHR